MTPEQFDAVTALLGQGGGKGRAAARLVLVAGLSSTNAARQVGCTAQAANQTVQRCRRVVELARIVAGVNRTVIAYG